MVYYVIAIAAAVAALGITFNYIAHLGTVIKTAEGRGDEGMTVSAVLTRFFFSTMIIELVPIVIMLLAYVLMDRPDNGLPVIPLIIILAAAAFGVTQVLIRMNQQVPAEVKGQVRSFSLISIQLITSMPLVALIFLFI
ncbi:hypothetical protein [Jeotgalibacillus terrae]|uniref:Uncharacterized protein n=1 Tax=Jeotgalibacillus terrae TaxID=587735 RepID=A0ABW5ZEA3_9BACL|nr:hypothetical protein [Jeotgalibacillus terrae]MBM7579446.1 hypothetical protein [Jeotgalibacillus terrae]